MRLPLQAQAICRDYQFGHRVRQGAIDIHARSYQRLAIDAEYRALPRMIVAVGLLAPLRAIGDYAASFT
jgi:hypothetical protein